MKSLKKDLKVIVAGLVSGTLLLSFMAVQFSCKNLQEDVPGPRADTTSKPDTTGYKDYLVLKNPVKKSGPLPAAVNGSLKINCPDTIYCVKGDPYMARIAILHKPETDITGFNVAVSGLEDNYYYEVPEEDWESSDSVSIVYISLQPSENDKEISYPYAVRFLLQPTTGLGDPKDEFTRDIICESANPEDNPDATWNEDGIYEWLYTASWDYQHSGIWLVRAPGMTSNAHDNSSDYYFAGCCADGNYFKAGTRLGAYGYCDSLNPYFRKILLKAPHSYIGYMYLFLSKSGNFSNYSNAVDMIFYPDLSICAKTGIWTPNITDYVKTGTFEITGGNSAVSGKISFNIQVSEPPFGPYQQGGAFLHTSHFLIIRSGNEEQADAYYMLREGIDPEFDVEAFRRDYWHED